MNEKEIVNNFYKSIDAILLPRLEHKKMYEKKINELWGKPILIFEAFADFGYTVFLKEFEGIREERTASCAIASTFIKGCLVLEEIFVLLRSGFPDGAMSCSRTLYELNVYLSVLVKYNNNKVLLERYFDYSDYEYYKELNDVKEHCELTGQAYNYTEELNKMIAIKQELIEKHGKEIKKDSFWYSCIPKCSNLAELAKHVGVNIARVFYKRGCQSLHSSPRNNFTPIGNEEEACLLSGSVLVGYENPIRFSAFSFSLMLSNLLDYFKIDDTDEYFHTFKTIYNDIIKEMELSSSEASKL